MTREDFALDLCRFSEPSQVVLAAIERKSTLAEAFTTVERKRADYQPAERAGRRLGQGDMLLVPNMYWRLEHHFKELEGADKILLNPGLLGLYLLGAEQVIEFRMDRNGAAVESQATIAAAGIGRLFLFDRPFLVVLSKRGAKQPYFVMWVDNAELLVKR